MKKLILEGPDSTKVESEVQMYLLSLKNSMLPEAIPIFTKYAESEVGAFNTIALTALQRYDVSLLSDEVQKHVGACGAVWCPLWILIKAVSGFFSPR